jgi:tetratricopeptide (TPR) repeat protein
MQRIILYVILIFFSLKVFPQEVMSFRYADSLTFKLYDQKNWSELINTGKKAISNGHDYYYMRMRMGIAYYERHNYSQSAKYFSRALEFNADDKTALEYLFYSYYLSGRYFQAWTVISGMNSSDRERIIKESRIKRNSVTIESYYLNAATEYITSDPELNFTNNQGGSQVVTKYFINNAVYLSHLTGKRSSYYHSFTNLVKHNYLHYSDGALYADLEEQKVVQNQYYGRFNFFTRTGLIFSPSFHILTAAYPLVAFSSTGMNPLAYTYNGQSNGFAGGFGITKTGGYFSFSGEAVYSKLNKIEQLQGTLSLIFYPAGNRNIYIGGNFSVLYNPGSDSREIRPVPGFIAGFAVSSKVWFEFSGTSGNMKNHTESNGLIIYNGIDYPIGKYSGKIILPFYKSGITLFAGAGIGSYSSEFLPFNGYNNYDPNKLNYKNYSFTGGLSWNF